ncbi:MAG: hypothetical protein Q7S27_00455 [Nanoarchaeota archaeon]|nr:hypothetical protein [Nanoarchaeota archaeon]
MKKRALKKEGVKTTEKILFLSVPLIVFGIAIYLGFNSSNISLGPDEPGMSYESAVTLLRGLGNEGIEWYCGERNSFVDAQGNSYGDRELIELKKILGNDMRLFNEFCSE